ncbi:MAG: RNA-binding S4 domain-containing protein [Culicoidibacterales bacterium]
MRLDKYLKVSRLVKRRPLAKQLCDAKRVSINGKIVKPGVVVKVDDVIEIRYGNRLVEAKVMILKDHVKKEDATTLYELIRTERIEQIEQEFVDDVE